MEFDLDQTRRESLKRGKALVDKGMNNPVSQVDQVHLMRYRDSQRGIVYRTGTCFGRCQCPLVENPQGVLVCPHTWRPCESRSVQSIVSLLEKVNS